MRSAKFSKIVIFFVCILLVFAVAAALLFDGAALSASGNVIAASGEGADRNSGAYPAVNYGYQHGTNIDRSEERSQRQRFVLSYARHYAVGKQQF